MSDVLNERFRQNKVHIEINNKVPLSICYLSSPPPPPRRLLLLRGLRDSFGFSLATTTRAARRQDRSFRGGTDASSRINFGGTKDRARARSMQFAKFPFAEAYAQLQLHYSSCSAARESGVEGRTGEKKLREAFASSSAVHGCINLTLSLHSVTPFLSHTSPSPSPS